MDIEPSEKRIKDTEQITAVDSPVNGGTDTARHRLQSPRHLRGQRAESTAQTHEETQHQTHTLAAAMGAEAKTPKTRGSQSVGQIARTHTK